LNALHKYTSVGGDGQHARVRLLAAQSFQYGEGARIDKHGARGATARSSQACSRSMRMRPDSHHTAGDKQHGLGHALQDVDEIIVAADVRQFVRKERFELRRAQTRQSRGGHKDDGTQPPDHGRHFHQRRLAQADVSKHATPYEPLHRPRIRARARTFRYAGAAR
jgi:hypothetical protein